ncbi:MAG: VOC family protein, partial [Alphaproteobacteria bacterium]|nr:VOC family protein [Alphaproteobacteria bacterium]
MAAVKPVPDGYPSLIPYLIVRDGAAAIEFYRKVFGAKLRMKLDGPGGRVGHAELEIG